MENFKSTGKLLTFASFRGILYKIFFLAGLGLLFTGCNPMKAYSDYDESVDFSVFSSFDFYESTNSGLDSLDHDRVKQSVHRVLTEKGNEFGSSPDLKVNFYAEQYQENRQHNLGVNIGTMGHRGGGSIGGGIPIPNIQNMLNVTFELVDAATSVLYWQATVETKVPKNLSGVERSAFFEKIVREAFKKYPPQKKN